MSNNKEVFMFYVYMLLDPRKKGRYTYDKLGMSFLYEPIYVGKATMRDKDRREFDHIKEADKNFTKGNQLKLNKIRSIKNSGQEPLICSNMFLSEDSDYVYEKERLLIETMGRVDLNTGILTNLTDGGDGPVNRVVGEEYRKKLSIAGKKYFKENSISEETRKKISEAMTGRYVSEETRKKRSDSMKGKTHTEETRKKISDKLKISMKGEGNNFYGKQHTEETKKKLREKNSGENHVKAQKYIVVYPDGKERIIHGLNKFCRELGINKGGLRGSLKTGKPVSKGKSKGFLLKEYKE